MITIGNIQVAELHGSGRGRADANSVTEVRRFRVAWRDRFAFREYMLGINQGSSIRNPKRHPENNKLIVASVEHEPFPSTKTTGTPTGDDPAIQYEWALVQVTYQPIQLSGSLTRPEQYSETYDFNAEFLTRPVDNAVHESNILATDLPAGFSLGVLIPGVEYEYTRLRMRDVPRATIYSRLGKVNNANFLDADPQHVLYVGARARSVYEASGERVWEVAHRFAIRGEGTWNEFYLPGSGWGQIRLGHGEPFAVMYQSVDMQPLLTGD